MGETECESEGEVRVEGYCRVKCGLSLLLRVKKAMVNMRVRVRVSVRFGLGFGMGLGV